MALTGLIWEGDHAGHLVKTDISVERTDSDEIAILARGENAAEASVYLSVDVSRRVAAMLLICSYSHEIQAHEAARIAESGGD